ncbi:MAG: DUF1566 domain-containing protein [Acidobacteriia bacterium]|nr:DUF1566 domain-containing protein [Terriglobia bacterium]
MTTRERRHCLTLGLFLSMLAVSRGATTNQFPNNQVSGTITFQGTPLAGVTVTAYNTNTSSTTQVTTTDENGNYSLGLPAWTNTAGTASADYHIWAIKPGYAFYPSVGPGANVTRADHTGDFMGNGFSDIAIYLTVIHYVALPNASNRGAAGPPLLGANFTAYDGSNPLVSLAPEDASVKRAFGWRSRFTDNQDGTVTDGVTGLIWLQNAGCLTPANWAGALAQVNGLASGACGLTDGSAAGQWRLPDLNELESLVDVSASNPALTPGNPFTNVSTAIYWTSTSYFGGQAGSPNAWAIRLSDGRYINDSVSNSKATASNQVWAVKGSGGAGAIRLQATGLYVPYVSGDDGSIQSGVPPTFPRWVDKGDGTVADTVTGLVWLKQADCINQNWAVALAAVAVLSSGQCGLTDGSQAGNWRMPSRNEMQSLSDRNENNHADFFDHTYFYKDGTFFQSAIFTNFLSLQYYWTSTADAADPTKAWTVYSCDFGVYDTPKANAGYTLAVRAAQPPDVPRRGTGLLRRRTNGL